jgi:hypothetical protein
MEFAPGRLNGGWGGTRYFTTNTPSGYHLPRTDEEQLSHPVSGECIAVLEYMVGKIDNAGAPAGKAAPG